MENDADASKDIRKLGELIDEVEVAMLTTLAPDGTLVSRPLHTLKVEFDGALLFFTSARSGKVDDLEKQPRVNVAYARPGNHTYVSVSGHASIDRDRDTIRELWSAPHKIFFPDGPDDPDLVILRVDVDAAEYWESSGGFIGRGLRFARAMAGGGPEALGEHRRLDV